MAEVRVKFSVSMLLALIAAELVSIIWYSHVSPWHHHVGYRYLFPGILFDALVVYILKFIKDNIWTIRSWEDCAILSLWLAALFTGYQAPHYVHDVHSASYFLYHAGHKFVFSFVILFVLLKFKQ